MSHANGYIWWEKTVEYAFARNLLPKSSLAFPLDGDIEKALGDLLLKEGTVLRLIEFKSEKKDIQREKEKWGFTKEEYPNDYKRPFHELLHSCYSECINDYPAHKAHWLIYGNLVGQELQLEAQDYWGENSNTANLQKHENLNGLTATDLQEMLRYLGFLQSKRGSSFYGLDISVIVGVAGGSTLSFKVEDFFKIFPGLRENLKEIATPKHTMKDRPKV